MDKEQINIKDYELVMDDGMVWLAQLSDEGIGKTLVFPTAKSFLDAVIEHGKAKEDYTKSMKRYVKALKENIKVLGNMELVVKHIFDSWTFTEEQNEQLNNIDCIMFEFTEYCAVSGLHYEEVTKQLLKDIVPEETLPEKYNELYTIIDENAKEMYWYMNIEYGIAYETWLYPLSEEERAKGMEEAKKQNGSIADCPTCIKAVTLVLEEMIQLFGE